MYVDYWNCCESNESLPPLFLRNPSELDSGQLSYLSNRHYEYYKDEIDGLVNDYDSWNCLIFRSGMYGGKTSFVFSLLDRLKQSKDIDNTILVADVMRDTNITGRGYIGKEKKRNALQFGLEDFPNIEKVDGLVKSSKDVIILDEYTFLDTKVVNWLVDSCKRNSKKLILLGLDTNAFGQELPIFEDSKFKSLTKEKTSRVVECNSYVHVEDEKPKGVGSIRYFKIPNTNDVWALDLCILPLVISKELVNIIKYYPSLVLLSNSFKNNIFNRQLSINENGLKRQKELVMKYICPIDDRIQRYEG